MKLPPFEYPDHVEVRCVSANGGIRWKSRWVNVSQTLVSQSVGLEEMDNGIWSVYVGPIELGRLDERDFRIEDTHGKNCNPCAQTILLPMSPTVQLRAGKTPALTRLIIYSGIGKQSSQAISID